MTDKIDISKLSIQAWKIGDLIPAENNNKIHTDESVAKLAKSMSELGQIQPVIVDRDRVIIAGHGRTEAAKKLGWSKVKVIQLDVDRETAIRMRLADNLQSNQNYDREAIATDLGSLKELGMDVDLDIFQDERLGAVILQDLDPLEGMNMDAFSEDIGEDVQNMAEENETSVEEARTREVPIKQAFSFSKLTADEVRQVRAFMDMVRAETGIEDEGTAFVKWIEEVMT